MKLTVINGTTFDIEKKVNKFLSNLLTNDIYKVETRMTGTLTKSLYSIDAHKVAVFIWTKA